MADIAVDISTPQLDGIVERLGEASRAELHENIAGRLQTIVDNHLASYASSHHATAARLGARPSGNLEDAKVTATSGADGATVSVAAPGIRRALGPLTIRPKSRQSLTIPVTALAYGRTVADLKARGIDVFRPKGKNYLSYKENPKSKFSTVLYILAKRATLHYEPDLLPRRETLAANAAEAARDYIMEGAA
ncbi:MAG: hypothetical protein IKE55_01405 [Kiritimatiellae bacterium]|nr:hypothetical protein [Kiritimatiellia bacterium]